jgi:uncharacterized protein (TIGR02996 family)
VGETGRALFAEVCERVDDDAVKLVYADWLEDEGGEPDRARAIRLGVERRRLDDLDPRAWVIDAELGPLNDYPPRRWKKGLPRLPGGYWEWSGGLVAGAMYLSPAQLLRREDRIFSAGPITRVGVMVEDPGETEELLACSYLPRIRSLAIGGIARPEVVGLSALARSPALAGLHELRLSQCDHQAELLVSMARCPPLPALRSLDLSRNYFQAGGLRALAGAPMLATLHELDLSRSVAGTRGLRELLRSPHLGGLRKLDLAECGGDTAAARDLAAYPWRVLEWLDLSMNSVGPVAGRLLGESPALRRLRYLDLGGTPWFGEEGARGLARSANLPELRVLDLAQCRLTRAGLAALAEAPWLPNLRGLTLGDKPGVKGVRLLASAPLSNLRKLAMHYAELGDAEVRALLTAPWLAGLTHLELDNNKITDAGAVALAGADRLDRVVHLDLCGNAIGPRGRGRLRRRFGGRVELKRPWED